MRRRLIVSLLTVALATLLAPAAAWAKGGVMFDPPLSELTPGQPTPVRLFVGPGHETDGAILPPPPKGVVPVLVLRADGQTVRFSGTPLGARHRSRMVVTLPQTRRAEVWTINVRVAGRTYPSMMEASVLTPPNPAAPADGGVVAVGEGAAAAPIAANDNNGADRPPAWPFVAGAVAVALAAGAAIVAGGVRRRSGRPRRIQPGG
jgi:hypothetical protein